MKLPSIQEQIEKKLSLSELIGTYLKITKKGSNYLAICPFHDDQKPSLTISNSKNIWKCFVCDVGGGGIKFVMLFFQINFWQASKKIAEKFALVLPETWKEQEKIDPELEKLAEINQEAKIFFQMNLIKNLEMISHPLKSFCQKRHIDNEIIDKFQLGWADKNETKLWEFCLAKGFKEDELITSGLFFLRRKQKQEVIINYFQKQIIFPIYDQNNLLVGFSGRQIEEENIEKNYNSSKYINSPETLLFKKGKILYNWNLVKKQFPITQKIYLVEGIMDAIRLTVHNYPALALMGTNLGQCQINLIKEHFKEVIIFPDPDKAGLTSALKNSLSLLKAGKEVKIVSTSLWVDPDLALQNKNFNLKNVALQTPVDFLFSCYKKQKKKNSEELINLIKKITPFLVYLEPLKKSEIKQNLAEISQFSKEEITEQFSKFNEKTTFSLPEKKQVSRQLNPQKEKWKKYLFQSLLLNLELLKSLSKIIGSFNDLEYNYYYQFLVKWYNSKTTKRNLSWENFLFFMEKQPKIQEWFKKKYKNIERNSNFNN